MSGRFCLERAKMAPSAAVRHTDSESQNGLAEYIEMARKKLIVALDFSTIAEARDMVKSLGDEVVFYKVGLGLEAYPAVPGDRHNGPSRRFGGLRGRTNFLGRQARGDPDLASYRGLIDP